MWHARENLLAQIAVYVIAVSHHTKLYVCATMHACNCRPRLLVFPIKLWWLTILHHSFKLFKNLYSAGGTCRIFESSRDFSRSLWRYCFDLWRVFSVRKYLLDAGLVFTKRRTSGFFITGAVTAICYVEFLKRWEKYSCWSWEWRDRIALEEVPKKRTDSEGDEKFSQFLFPHVCCARLNRSIKCTCHLHDRYKRKKIACIGMWPQMHFLDLQQLDRWRNGCTIPNRWWSALLWNVLIR